ncbi:MAG: hypothetical protein J6X34_04825, partial [Clostridia bacterium]|nr:hypothetical protein [Clostridia bacterium]
ELGEGYIDDEVYNPTDEQLANTKEFIALDSSVMEQYNRVWETFRLTDDDEKGSVNLTWLYVLIAVAVVGVIVFFVIRKKKRDKLRYDD